jgi:phosphoenolpyruvate carboxylase
MQMCLQALTKNQKSQIDAMYKDWPFFKVTLDMLAMVLAKADDITLGLYEEKLVDPALHYIGQQIRTSFRQAHKAILCIVGDSSVLGHGAHCIMHKFHVSRTA